MLLALGSRWALTPDDTRRTLMTQVILVTAGQLQDVGRLPDIRVADGMTVRTRLAGLDTPKSGDLLRARSGRQRNHNGRAHANHGGRAWWPRADQ